MWAWIGFQHQIVLYTHKVWMHINNNNSTNTGGTNEFIYFYFQSLATRGGRDTNHKANHTYADPPPPQRMVHLVVFKISAVRDPKWSAFQIRKTQPRASTVETQLIVFSKSSKILRSSHPGMTSSTSQFTPTAIQSHILSGGGYDSSWSSYPFRAGVRVPTWLYTWTKRHRVVQSLTKLDNKI